MNNLIIKEVSFYGVTLVAMQDKESGKIFAGVKWMCVGMGLSEGQTKSERLKIQEDLALKPGGRKFVLTDSLGRNQETLCLEIKFVPLWLAKINITPTIQREQPELAERLLKYQLEVADVLANAFIADATKLDYSHLSPDLQMFKKIFDAVAQSQLEQAEVNRQLALTTKKVEAVQDTVASIRDTIIVRDNDWRHWINQMFNKTVKASGTNDYQVFRTESYDILEYRAQCRLDIRLSNLRARLAEAGASKTKINNTSKLDVIESDCRLKEIYTSIIKEMAIQHTS